MFRVGQKVVCVNDDVNYSPKEPGVRYYGGLDGLRRGEIYTIRNTGTHPNVDQHHVVWLCEIKRDGDSTFQEAPFSAIRFRPVQDIGMEMLRNILVRPDVPIKEDA